MVASNRIFARICGFLLRFFRSFILVLQGFIVAKYGQLDYENNLCANVQFTQTSEYYCFYQISKNPVQFIFPRFHQKKTCEFIGVG